MTDDIPISDPPASQIWAKRGLDGLFSSEVRQMTAYIYEEAGAALAIEPAEDLTKKPHIELLALAIRAQNAQVPIDVVASLLVLAVARGSNLAAAALRQIVGQRLEELSFSNSGVSGRRDLLRLRNQIERRLGQRILTEKFEDFRKEFDAVGEVIRQADMWTAFRRAGVDDSGYRLIAPNLKSLKHLEAGDEFKPLLAPLPIWRSPISPSVLSAVLEMEFPHVAGVANDIANFVAGGPAASHRPILLVGPAGIGKDSILRRAAELVGRPIGEYDVAGSSDNRIIKGTSKGWSSASPGLAATICTRYLCANPLLVFSELDRAGGSRRNGQVNEAFLGLCEPSTRCRWYDDGLGTELDLSDVALAFTSNGVADTPGPLLTRLRILHLASPEPEHVRLIVQQARRRLANELNVPLEAIAEPVPEVLHRLEAIAKKGRFQLRLADRIVRALGPSAPQRPLN